MSAQRIEAEKIRAEWVKRLRSGTYKQGRGRLRKANDEYCCLGILCEAEGLEWNPKTKEVHGGNAYTIGDIENYAMPPVDISRKAGMTKGMAMSLASLNDKTPETPFAEIADVIEKLPYVFPEGEDEPQG